MKTAQLALLGVASIVGAAVALLFVTSIEGAVATLLFTVGGGLLGCATLSWIDAPSKTRARVARDVREAAAAGVSVPEIAAVSHLSELEVNRILHP
ncbi:hypothetical protein [Gordonia sp. 'Campus']|uniref:hypothetical protein n=1 Tax=Gordonia sp. 'Campus' TaxID=2915824 RepID=UPI001EE3B774|nr:hypothetical protein [Gordonia sp. 'Campus']